jgi:hypothetical protein
MRFSSSQLASLVSLSSSALSASVELHSPFLALQSLGLCSREDHFLVSLLRFVSFKRLDDV